METESDKKDFNFLDVTIINAQNGNYEFKIYRKPAITNVQIKPNSCVDPKVVDSTFKGFLIRAERLCSPKYINEEIGFLLDNFAENGHDHKKLEKIVASRKNKDQSSVVQNERQVNSKRVVLPWVPGVSPKLRKEFRKAGFQVTFRPLANLEMLLTSKNKPSLPMNSLAGVYEVQCNCGEKYIGETSTKVSTRIKQHQKDIFQAKWKNSGLSEHASKCSERIDWTGAKTISIECNHFSRKVREALEIQLRKPQMNRDDGDYVTTRCWEPLLAKMRKT